MFGWLAALSVLFSQGVNIVTLGQPGMTVSARAGYARDHGSKFGSGLCRVLDVVDLKSDGDSEQDHCNNAKGAHERRSRKEQP